MAGTIAVDNTANGTGDASSSLNFDITIAGSNRILFVFTQHEQLTSCTATATKGGVDTAMTELPTVSPQDSANRRIRVFYIVAPDTGTCHIKMTKGGGTGVWAAQAASYTGVAQTGIPDASSIQSQASGTSMTSSVTTIMPSCWVICCTRADAGTLAASTNSTLRGSIVQNAGIFDSNNGVSTGSYAMTQTMATGASGSIIFSIAGLSSTISVSDTLAGCTDAYTFITAFIINVSDSLSGILDVIKTKLGWRKDSRGSSTWTNQDI